MHRKCISSGEVQCDDCHRIIPHPESYLVTEETEGVISRFCVDCCLKRGYAHYRDEKGKRVLTFLPEAEL